MAWDWLCWGFWAWNSVRLVGHWGNAGQVWHLLVVAEWLTAAGGRLQCAGALVKDSGLASSCECWSQNCPSSAGSRFQAVLQFPGPQAVLALDLFLQAILQVQLLEEPVLHRDGMVFLQHLQAVG